MATTVTYKGNTIATVSNNTKTLKTAGTMMEDDVTLVDISSSGGITTVTILPEQSVTANVQETSGYSIYLDDITEQLIDGENYIVTIDGDPYTCHAATAWESIYAGDVNVVWGSPTTALFPFMLGSYANNRTQWGYGDNNAHTVKIERVVSFSAPELISKSITANGTYDPADDNADGYSEVIVNVSGGGGTTWETLKEGTFTIYSSSPNYMLINSYTTPFLENETYRITWGSDVYVFQTASDGGYSVDGYYVGNAGVVGGQDDGSGATFFIYRDQASRAVAAVTDPAGSKFLRIEKQVSSGGGGNYQAKTGITPTTSSQTITADSGYDALESVQIDAMPTGTAGTPTATKGTVSNHAVSVTPSVTNTTGYITGETKTGTAVSVTAAELASGNKEITANGTNIDVVGYSTVSVAVPSSESSKNVQTAQSTTRRNNTALGSITSLTCSTAGTYEVYWTCARSNTSQTWGSQLYINGVAYDAENTTWSNNVQNNHLTGITLAKNDTVAVYGRSRSGYYIYAPQLTIIQTA